MCALGTVRNWLVANVREANTGEMGGILLVFINIQVGLIVFQGSQIGEKMI